MVGQVICPHTGTARLRIRLKKHSSTPASNPSKCRGALGCKFKLHACSTKASGI